MDEDEYKAAHENIVSVPCPFEKSILAFRLCCGKSSKINLAEREAVSCASIDCQSRCTSWLQLLRKKSQFALRLTGVDDDLSVLPHTKEMKVQVGGVYGLAALLADETQKAGAVGEDALHDVFLILDACLKKFDRMEQLHFEPIVKSVASFRLRR